MIPLFKVFMSDSAGHKVISTLHSGYIGEGPKVKEFETALEIYLGCSNLLATNSCTSALQLALSIFRDDVEVLVCPLTCFATTTSILSCKTRMRIKWVDVDPNTGNMCLDDLEKKLGERSKIVLPVHFAGYPVDLVKLRQIQDRFEQRFGYRFIVLEDAAQAFGTKVYGKFIGNHDNYVALSFQAVKTLTCGDGGALVCPKKYIYQMAKELRWYGLDRDKDRLTQDVFDPGWKYGMNDIAATIGLSNLPYIGDLIDTQRRNWNYYKDKLPELSFAYNVPTAEPNGYLYPLKVERRDDFIRHMASHGIEASQIHKRNDKYSCVQYLDYGDCPNLDNIDPMLCFIPSNWSVRNEDRLHIVNTIKKGW